MCVAGNFFVLLLCATLTGPALFEIGALFFISKMFFFGEDDERRIERLEREV
jgi:hypothetical protein